MNHSLNSYVMCCKNHTQLVHVRFNVTVIPWKNAKLFLRILSPGWRRRHSKSYQWPPPSFPLSNEAALYSDLQDHALARSSRMLGYSVEPFPWAPSFDLDRIVCDSEWLCMYKLTEVGL